MSSGMRECWFKASILYLEKAAAAKRGAGGRKPARTRFNYLGTRRYIRPPNGVRYY
jgi:hypothetical protein